MTGFDRRVGLDENTPVPLERGLALARKKAAEHYIYYGRTNPYDEENIIKAHLADHADKDREAARKQMLAGTRRETLKHVAAGAVVGALIEAGVFVALRLAGIL